MPLYEFHCQDCEMIYEERRPFAQASERSTCPSCQSEHTNKLISMATFISNGSQMNQATLPSTPAASAGCGCGSCDCAN